MIWDIVERETAALLMFQGILLLLLLETSLGPWVDHNF